MALEELDGKAQELELARDGEAEGAHPASRVEVLPERIVADAEPRLWEEAAGRWRRQRRRRRRGARRGRHKGGRGRRSRPPWTRRLEDRKPRTRRLHDRRRQLTPRRSPRSPRPTEPQPERHARQ